ncbi:hypothetical protein Zmor_008641 [Zophobas morio]|uniref:Uncharacterized protein n=1 Tax=Zophobas morio TaxID=2755281 RepID=A0AA38HJL3_9CUCU|nr:hypothetical protein Zmor_008641 [Zophobas morio]
MHDILDALPEDDDLNSIGDIHPQSSFNSFTTDEQFSNNKTLVKDLKCSSSLGEKSLNRKERVFYTTPSFALEAIANFNSNSSTSPSVRSAVVNSDSTASSNVVNPFDEVKDKNNGDSNNSHDNIY